jgi:Na+-translocating ferredoxin:NAD+ oxidoreductase RnfE subunit
LKLLIVFNCIVIGRLEIHVPSRYGSESIWPDSCHDV